MPEEPIPQSAAAQPKFICPWCGVDIDGVEFRPFGPNGIVTMFGCKVCLKPLPAFILPPEPEQKPKPSIIQP